MREETLTYRPADRSDLPAITSLLSSCGLPADDIAEHLPRVMTVFADSVLIAAVGLEVAGDVGLLRSLVVSADWRGRGIADELCRRIVDQARTSGVQELYLLTTTAQRYFARRGWSIVDRRQAPAAIQATREFSTLCPDSAAFMARVLSPTRQAS